MKILILLAVALMLPIASYGYSSSDMDYSDYETDQNHEFTTNTGCTLTTIVFPKGTSDDVTIEYQGPLPNPKQDEGSNYCNRTYSINGQEQDASEESVKVLFKQKNKAYAEYTGQMINGHWTQGKFTFANGEMWVSDHDGVLGIVALSEAKTKIKQVEKAAYDKEEAIKNKQVQLQKETDAKDHKIYVQKVAEFRKNMKPGSEVRLKIGDYLGRGFVLKTTKDTAEVQVNFLWMKGNQVPYVKRVWFNKRELEPI